MEKKHINFYTYVFFHFPLAQPPQIQIFYFWNFVVIDSRHFLFWSLKFQLNFFGSSFTISLVIFFFLYFSKQLSVQWNRLSLCYLHGCAFVHLCTHSTCRIYICNTYKAEARSFLPPSNVLNPQISPFLFLTHLSFLNFFRKWCFQPKFKIFYS